MLNCELSKMHFWIKFNIQWTAHTVFHTIKSVNYKNFPLGLYRCRLNFGIFRTGFLNSANKSSNCRISKTISNGAELEQISWVMSIKNPFSEFFWRHFVEAFGRWMLITWRLFDSRLFASILTRLSDRNLFTTVLNRDLARVENFK